MHQQEAYTINAYQEIAFHKIETDADVGTDGQSNTTRQPDPLTPLPPPPPPPPPTHRSFIFPKNFQKFSRESQDTTKKYNSSLRVFSEPLQQHSWERAFSFLIAAINQRRRLDWTRRAQLSMME
ncbi:hypothetical protein DAPPUDRAFT_240800 [Daphnia pulex]|uniref:Uncharacterized protein n=1 Tax=Daphnia pulex TaxID=6669 RepID=E9GCL3_DAPPU|nr:hypothetical protein DAPPUDRAFT_240800 [Daphnia pulex]|eukprot:EFX82578.1 hypothetical protein DAPPUDRAFT_240800 [Daphnia pulex]